MHTLFVVCAALGGAILVLQFILGLLGVEHGAGGHDFGHDVGHDLHGSHAHEGFNLLSVRALSAGVAFFGIGGLILEAAGIPLWLAVVAAFAGGFAAAAAVAFLMRAMLRLEDDGTVVLEHALGQPGTVYVPIPAGREGRGKVLLTVQSRTVEIQAVTPDAAALPTGTPVTVVGIVSPDTVEVVVTPTVGELLDA